LEVFGSLVSVAAGVTKAINDNEAAQRQLEKLKHHNRFMEGHGTPRSVQVQTKSNLTEKIKKVKKNIKQMPKMPKNVIINCIVQLQQLVMYAHSIFYRYV